MLIFVSISIFVFFRNLPRLLFIQSLKKNYGLYNKVFTVAFAFKNAKYFVLYYEFDMKILVTLNFALVEGTTLYNFCSEKYREIIELVPSLMQCNRKNIISYLTSQNSRSEALINSHESDTTFTMQAHI